MSTVKTKPLRRLYVEADRGDGPPPLRLTPAWAGRDMSLEEFDNADYLEGWRFELIDGRVEVFPPPSPRHNYVAVWIAKRLNTYIDSHPRVINFVTPRCRVFVPRRQLATCPEPDLAAYRDYPTRWPPPMFSWQDVQPILTIEIISPRYAHKDLGRNVVLYGEAPSVREYWIFDPRDRKGNLTLRAYRKRGVRSWQRPIDVPFGGTYTTPLLPGFTLIVDPSA
jgi:Uma2 family endonuclease